MALCIATASLAADIAPGPPAQSCPAVSSVAPGSYGSEEKRARDILAAGLNARREVLLQTEGKYWPEIGPYYVEITPVAMAGLVGKYPERLPEASSAPRQVVASVTETSQNSPGAPGAANPRLAPSGRTLGVLSRSILIVITLGVLPDSRLNLMIRNRTCCSVVVAVGGTIGVMLTAVGTGAVVTADIDIMGDTRIGGGDEKNIELAGQSRWLPTWACLWGCSWGAG